MTKRGAIILDLLFVCIAAMFILIAATRYNFYARLVPLIIGIPCLLLGIIKLVQTLGGASPGRPSPEVCGEAPPSVTSAARESKRERNALAWLLGTGISLYIFGFTVVIHGFLICFLRWGIGESWKTTLITTALVFLLYYGIFIQIVHIGFWEGLVYHRIFN